MDDISDHLKLRRAVTADIPLLVQHRRWMFEEMAKVQGGHIDPAEMVALDESYQKRVAVDFTRGTFFAWVVEDGEDVVASGAVSLLENLPAPGNVSGWSARLHAVYTTPEYRKLGLARQICTTAVEFCRAKGIKVVSLGASVAGRHLYESLGFQPVDTEMRQSLD